MLIGVADQRAADRRALALHGKFDTDYG